MTIESRLTFETLETERIIRKKIDCKLPVRNINHTTREVRVGMENVNPDQIRVLVTIADSIQGLADPDMLTSRLRELLADNEIDNTLDEMWGLAAYDYVQEHLGKEESAKKYEIGNTLRSACEITEAIFPELPFVSGDELDSKFTKAKKSIRVKGNKYEVVGVCPASGVVKRWIKTAEEVFIRIHNEDRLP